MLLALAVAVMAAGCAGTSTVTEGELVTPVPTQEAAAPSTTSRTISLGVAAGRRTGQTPIDALVGVEQLAGRRLDVLRAYVFWDSEFPDLRHQRATEGARTLHLSINARRTDGSVVPWSSIAAAEPGDEIHGELVAWIDRLAAYDGPLRITFHHEADIEPEFGTGEDFVAAWRRFVSLLDAAAPQIDTAWVLTGFNLDREVADQFWPGDDYVDIIGADAFNWYGCRGNPEAWRSPQEVLAPLLTFGAKHPDKPLMLAELGSDEDDELPGRKAQWLADLAELLASDDYRRIETVIFFHNDHDADSTCDWWLDSSEETADAVSELAQLRLFGGDTAEAAAAQCRIVASTESAISDLALVDGDGDGRFDFEFGAENRFVGIGDQSSDGADHRALLRFDPLGPLPADATVELRVRVGERQPSLDGPIELRLVSDFEVQREAFNQEGELLVADVFDGSTVGGHHVIELTGLVDTTQPVTLRLQLSEPPTRGNGQHPLFIGMGDANRSIDRPTLIARTCSS